MQKETDPQKIPRKTKQLCFGKDQYKDTDPEQQGLF
jgi:hypothetical protein